MQSKESRACEAGEYLGRLRRAMPMQVYIYICWQLELSGNANLRLYQCWFAFTHRSPIKKFASLRLRKNLVELRARLSLLVDKTTFQYRALTIYCTTIDGHAPSFRPPAPAAVAEWAATDAPGSPPPAPQPWRKRPPWTRRITTSTHATGEGWDALDAPDHPPAPAAAREGGTPWTRPDHTSTRSRGGRKNRRVYARLFYFLSQKSMYNILPSNAFKISTSNDNIFLSFLQSPPNWGNVSNLVKQYFVIHGNLSL